MKKMLSRLALSLTMLVAGVAYADATLTVSGQFSNGATLTGQFIVDASGNIVQDSVDLDFAPPDPISPVVEFYNLLATLSDGDSVTLQVSNGTGADLGLSLTFGGSLGNPMFVGPITGGFVSPFDGGAFPTMCGVGCLASELTGTISAAPEPAMFALVGLGLAGLAATRRRRH